jgi:hypothetical protein
VTAVGVVRYAVSPVRGRAGQGRPRVAQLLAETVRRSEAPWVNEQWVGEVGGTVVGLEANGSSAAGKEECRRQMWYGESLRRVGSGQRKAEAAVVSVVCAVWWVEWSVKCVHSVMLRRVQGLFRWEKRW